jgi:eukaryotic-like serine/threonine-protein kinase
MPAPADHVAANASEAALSNAADLCVTDQTCLMDASSYEGLESNEFSAVMRLGGGNCFGKQERDFVLAAFLLRGRHISDRALRNALRNWTPFGDLPLREFLRQKRQLSEEVLTRVEEEVTRYLKSLDGRDSWKNEDPAGARRTSSLLDRVDPTGQVAKVFGISQIPKPAVGDESRTFQTRIRLLRKLGQGGLGTVWLAVDSTLNRHVAVKELTRHIDRQSAAYARFRREAEITGRLEHPSIVPIHLLGENESDGRLFYVMRFLGNRTLEDAIREYHERRDLGAADPLAFHQLLTAFTSVCQAVAYAHSRKVIHRDLKPQNIALDSFGQVIVLDWGLAKVLEEDDATPQAQNPSSAGSADHLDVTRAGQIMGTPMYMAPEQAAGRIDDIDERTDVYGLGAILFSILTGYAPHELTGESLAPGSRVSALLDVIVNQPVTPPRQLNSKVPAELEAICLRAMAKDRHVRYASAEALSQDLQRWFADEPIAALADSQVKRIRRWTKAHRARSLLLTMGLTLLLVGAAALGFAKYEDLRTAEQVRFRTAADETRELQAKLAFEIDRLAENARFVSALPPIQPLLDGHSRSGGESWTNWTQQLQSIDQGLLDGNPSYLAITFWKDEPSPFKPVRVETAEVRRGLVRSDITEFLGRHFPAIKALSAGDVYVGMPGRLAKVNMSLTEQQRKFAAESSEPVGRTLVAGIRVFDKNSGAKAGGVAIECDLEKILRSHLATNSRREFEVAITDHRGVCVMRFSREKGLRPASAAEEIESTVPEIREFFSRPGPSDLCIVSGTLCAARVPLSRTRPEHTMGVIVEFLD